MAAEKAELWDRWKRARALKSIGRASGEPSSSVYHQLARHGGIETPAERFSAFVLRGNGHFRRSGVSFRDATHLKG